MMPDAVPPGLNSPSGPFGYDEVRPLLDALRDPVQAVRTGAAIAGADAAALDAVTQYAEKIGLAFQVADDILDVEGTTEQLGKTAGKDRQAGKQTYPAVYGLPESRRHAAKLVSQAVQCLEPFGQKARMLASLADFIVTRTS